MVRLFIDIIPLNKDFYQNFKKMIKLKNNNNIILILKKKLLLLLKDLLTHCVQILKNNGLIKSN